MKRIILYTLVLCTFFACKDEEPIFDAKIEASQISFVPFEGGAYMNYNLPQNAGIRYIVAEYTNFKNEPVTVKASYLSNTVKLKGFVDAEKDVLVYVSLEDKQGNRSEKQTLRFSTLKSAAKSFFDDLQIKEYWDGFVMEYTAPEIIDAFVHIGVIDTNRITNKIDTLLLKTEIINSGNNRIKYAGVSKDKDSTDVVIWTEDFEGNPIKKQVFPKVPSAKTKLLDLSVAPFYGSSLEYRRRNASKKFLFDGDKNGVKRVEYGEDNQGFTFVSGTNEVPGNWVIDLGKEEILGIVRLYCTLHSSAISYWSRFWQGNPAFSTPNRFKIYGSNDPNLPFSQWQAARKCDGSGEWVELGEYHQDIFTPEAERWVYPLYDPLTDYNDAASISEADPAFAEVLIDLTGASYRYVRLEVLETFKYQDDSNVDSNPDKRVILSELEVYVKK